MAAPPSTSYRFKKFVKRNRVRSRRAAQWQLRCYFGVAAFAWQFKLASDQRDIAIQAQQAEEEPIPLLLPLLVVGGLLVLVLQLDPVATS
ncbi:MAG: hypothetical protein HC794_08490 [Nitrospiraceae bacterium]|nr:hypothetical protein [Nitrospiraceae bacterium]